MFVFLVTEEQLPELIGDLLIGGTETIADTLLFAIIFMLHHPDIRMKVQQEIDEQLGRETPPSMQDVLRMPLVEATILEVQRLVDVIPLGLLHTTMEEIKFMGYSLPEGTNVLPNLYAVHRYEYTRTKIWPLHYHTRFFASSLGNCTEIFPAMCQAWLSV